MKRVLITGAASGMGAHAAQTLAERVWEVVATDIRGGDGVVAMDVTVADAWATTVASYGPFDALVNSAGIRTREKFLDLSLEDWERTIRINLTGSFLGIQAVARQMVEDDRPGAIVNIASVNAFAPVKRQPDYLASKAGGPCSPGRRPSSWPATGSG